MDGLTSLIIYSSKIRINSEKSGSRFTTQVSICNTIIYTI